MMTMVILLSVTLGVLYLMANLVYALLDWAVYLVRRRVIRGRWRSRPRS